MYIDLFKLFIIIHVCMNIREESSAASNGMFQGFHSTRAAKVSSLDIWCGASTFRVGRLRALPIRRKRFLRSATDVHDTVSVQLLSIAKSWLLEAHRFLSSPTQVCIATTFFVFSSASQCTLFFANTIRRCVEACHSVLRPLQNSAHLADLLIHRWALSSKRGY